MKQDQQPVQMTGPAPDAAKWHRISPETINEHGHQIVRHAGDIPDTIRVMARGCGTVVELLK